MWLSIKSRRRLDWQRAVKQYKVLPRTEKARKGGDLSVQWRWRLVEREGSFTSAIGVRVCQKALIMAFLEFSMSNGDESGTFHGEEDVDAGKFSKLVNAKTEILIKENIKIIMKIGRCEENTLLFILHTGKQKILFQFYSEPNRKFDQNSRKLKECQLL